MTTCQILAAKQSALQQQILATQSLIALNEAGLANDDPKFPTWDMAGVIGRLVQLQPGPLADRYWSLFILMCQIAGLQSGTSFIATAQKAGNCLGTGS